MQTKVIEFKFKKGTFDKVQALAPQCIAEARNGVMGLKHVLAVDLGGERGLLVLSYDDATNATAATALEQQILGPITQLLEAPITATHGYKVLYNEFI